MPQPPPGFSTGSSKTATPSKKPSGFLHAVGGFFHDLIYGDEQTNANIAAAQHKVSTSWKPPGVIKLAAETAEKLAYPVIHPIEFLEATGQEVNQKIYKPIIGLFGERDLPIVGHVPAQTFKGNLSGILDPMQIAEAPGLSWVPGWRTSFRAIGGVKPQGSDLIIDALGLFGGEIGAFGKLTGEGRLHPILKKGTELVGDATHLLGKVPGGRAAADVLSRRTSGTRSSFPTSRTAELRRIPTSQRAVENQVGRLIGTDLGAIAKMKLSEPEMTALRHDFLDRGIRPSDPKLGEAYDRIKTWSEDNRARKLEASVPEEVAQGLRLQTEAAKWDKFSTVLGPERTAAMFEAFRRGGENPFPELNKAWREIVVDHGKRVRAKLREMRLYEFDSGLPLRELPEAFDTTLPAAARNPALPESFIPGTAEPFRPPGLLPEAARLPAAAETLGPEVYTWDKYIQLRRAKAMWERGDMPTEAYEALVTKLTPARYKPGLADAQLARQMAKMRRDIEPGFGGASLNAALDDIPQTWVSLKRDGVEPVWVHRMKKATETEPLPRVGPEFTTAKPSSMKNVASTEATMYHDQPVVMMMQDEFQLASQTITQKAIAETVQATGGKSYGRLLDELMNEGRTKAQAEEVIRANWDAVDLEGTLHKPEPGRMLVRKDVGKAIKHYTGDVMPGLVEKGFGMWMVPVLHLSPAFHMNNIVSGAFLTALKAHEGPLALLRYTGEALSIMRRGEMDPRIPLGMGQAPQLTRMFTRDSRLAEGSRLAGIWEKIPGAGTVLERAERLNSFFDSLYKTTVYLDEYYHSVKHGVDTWTARDRAGAAAANLMQNWDAFVPLERQIVQRIYPFWGFRKAMMRTIITYPMDHPIRMQFLWQISRDAKEREDLPEEWKYKLGIGGTSKDGKRTYISLQGLDPFNDVSDIFTMQGFLHNVHPFFRTFLEAVGVEGYRSGSPLFTRKGTAEQDPYSGLARRKPDPGAIWGLVPQIEAIANAVKARLDSGVPPPAEDTREGWLRWFDKYGASLRITPGISYRSEKEAMEAFKKTQELVQSFNRPSKTKKSSAPAQQTAPTGGSPNVPAYRR